MKFWIFMIFILFADAGSCLAQSKDSAKPATTDNTVHIYFIITAGETIKAYYNDKPVEVETISDFNTYIQAHAKTLKDSWVIVTGKPKTGTFDDVIKTLSHYRFKHVTKNILTN